MNAGILGWDGVRPRALTQPPQVACSILTPQSVHPQAPHYQHLNSTFSVHTPLGGGGKRQGCRKPSTDEQLKRPGKLKKRERKRHLSSALNHFPFMSWR
ncbi:uncharacterized [Tachysurus ichikawai]